MRESTLKKAFVGSKSEEPEIWRLLLQCGAESLADVASRPILPGVASPELIPDERPEMNDEEYQTLRDSLSGGSTGFVLDFLAGSFERSAVSDFFIEQIVASGKRVPAKRVFSYAKAIRYKTLSPRGHSLLFGRLGRRLLKNDPTDEDVGFVSIPPLEIFESSPNEEGATRAWREGSGDERVVVIAELRKRDPARAVELLREEWKKLKKGGCRHNCLNEFFVGLSENDLDFLQGLEKKTRDSGVLMVLRDLLANLPTSKYAQKTLERAEAFLKNPESLNDFGKSQGEREDFMFEEPDASTLRSAFLTLSRVPLAKWEAILSASPAEIRARLLKTRGLSHFAMAQTFSTAQLRSFSLFGASDEWFEVCCESFTDVFRFDPERRRYSEWYMLYNAFPQLHHACQEFLKSAVRTGRVDYFERLRAIWQEETAKKDKLETRLKFESRILQIALQFSPYPWSEELARVFCEMLVEQVSAAFQKNSKGANDGKFYLIEKLVAVLAYSPRAVREEFHDVVTKGNDVFTPDEDFIKAYSDACAWRERFDRLFGKSKEN